MMTKKMDTVLYWVFTGAFSLLMLFSATAYLMQAPQIVQGFQHLGFPLYLIKILGTAKLLGVIAIVSRRVGVLKEWAYAGFAINFIGASASHAFSGDSIVETMMPFVILALMFGSYFYWKKTPQKVFA